MERKEWRIGNCNRTVQECESFYEKGDFCGRFSTLDSSVDDPYNPSNCVYYQQHMDQIIEDDFQRNGLEESAEELERARKASLKVLRGLGSELTW